MCSYACACVGCVLGWRMRICLNEKGNRQQLCTSSFWKRQRLEHANGEEDLNYNKNKVIILWRIRRQRKSSWRRRWRRWWRQKTFPKLSEWLLAEWAHSTSDVGQWKMLTISRAIKIPIRGRTSQMDETRNSRVKRILLAKWNKNNNNRTCTRQINTQLQSNKQPVTRPDLKFSNIKHSPTS